MRPACPIEQSYWIIRFLWCGQIWRMRRLECAVQGNWCETNLGSKELHRTDAWDGIASGWMRCLSNKTVYSVTICYSELKAYGRPWTSERLRYTVLFLQCGVQYGLDQRPSRGKRQWAMISIWSTSTLHYRHVCRSSKAKTGCNAMPHWWICA